METLHLHWTSECTTPYALKCVFQVQDIAMSVFLQKNLPHEIRMLAFVILFETRPPFGLVSAITAHLLEEKDLHVASFAYSYLRSVARSRTPENHFL